MLPNVTMSLDVDEIERRGHALFDALDDEMAHAIERAGEIIAEEARQNHAFTNRTGDLEASIRSIPPVGRFLDGTLRGGVVADMPYASYVEGSEIGAEASASARPFLQPALEQKQSELDDEVQAAANRAAERAGFR
jgi:hypothetical protein